MSLLYLSIAILVVSTSTSTADPLYQHLDQHSQAIIRAIRTSSHSSVESQANFDLYSNGSNSSPCQTRAQLITAKSGGDQLLTSSTSEYRRQFVTNMTREAWNAYARHAWGQHHLLPLSLGQLDGWKAYSGQTLVGALSTLWLMDLKEEFALGRRWVEKEMIVDDRCLPKLGALLSAYALTGDSLFKAKAKEIADLYTPADLSLEKGDVPLLQHKLVLEEWMQQRLEYPYLSNITGDPKYLKRVRRMDRFFGSADRAAVHSNKALDEPDKSNWSVKVKAYIQSKGKDTADLEQYYDLIEALEVGGHLRPSRSGLVYIRDDQSLPISNLMSSRYCHFGATLALGQLHRLTTPIGLAWQKYSAELQQTVRHLDLAKKVVELCHLAATSTETGLPPLKFFVDESRRSSSGVLIGGAQQTQANLESSSATPATPEVFCWSEGLENSCQRSASSSRSFDLGPQLAESYFVLWRLTGDQRYREYAWSLTKAIYKHARTVNGYAEVRDVLQMPAAKEDYQPAHFLSATLKYLYLIFSDDHRDQLPLQLDSWVFTSDGQPLPVCESSVCFESGTPPQTAPLVAN